jgi:hypothetical protein
MPTLEELFRSKQLVSQGGKTAEEAYAVQNSKKIRISSSNPLVSIVGMLPAKGARALLGIKGSESLLEEELVGLRIIRAGSIPFIYGSDIGRITLRTTDSLSTMKTATSGEVTGASGLLAKVGSAVSSVKSALGLPTNAIPTFVTNGLTTDDLSNPQQRYAQLERILKSAEGTAAGKLLGFIGKNAGGGTPDAMARNLVGGAIKEGKKALAQKIFGTRGSSSLGLAQGNVPSGITPKPSNQLTTQFTQDSLAYWGKFGFNYGMLEPTEIPTTEDKGGSKYSKTIDTTEESKDGLSAKQIVSNVPTIQFSAEPERASKFSKITKNPNYKDISKENFLESKRGMYTVSDLINKQGPYNGESKKVGNAELDDLDFVTLKFTSLGTVKGALQSANFRATISGLSETFSPSWDSGKFIGSPFNYYTYSGIERSVSFNFKVYSLNASEHKIAWDKLNFLTGLVYPADYYGNSAVKAPIIKFTLGDMYKGKAAFIESLSYTFDDNTPWQIMDKEQSMSSDVSKTGPSPNPKNGIPQNGQIQEIDMKGYKLPTIVDVAVSIKFIENRNETGIQDGNRKFYTFTPQSIT